MNVRAALLLVVLPTILQAAEPEVVDIRFEGNTTTREGVLRRELVWVEGTAPDAEALEDDRQALLDLGLFREVDVSTDDLPEGRVLTYRVREKYYLLPLPRISANVDGRYSYGAQVRWSNVLGLNHRMVLYGQRENAETEGVGEEVQYALDYVAPALTGRYETLAFGVSHLKRPVEDATGMATYEERIDTLGINWSRQLTQGRSNQGWSVGVGPSWRRQVTAGATAPPSDGEAVAVGGQLGYRNLRFKVYSDEGLRLGIGVDAAVEGLAADYDFVRWRSDVAWFRPLGDTPHQSLQLFAEVGGYHGGPASIDAFALGGGGQLRAFERDFIEGDAYYRLAAEWLRPLHWPWLRTLVVLEAGNVFEDVSDVSLSRVYTSLGLGVRLRITQFVNLEVELGWAFPIGQSGSGAAFGGRP